MKKIQNKGECNVICNVKIRIISIAFIIVIVMSSVSSSISQKVVASSTTCNDDWIQNAYIETNNTINYAQLCLDFIQENYPDKTIERYNSYIEGPDRETEFTYTVITAHLYPGETPSGDPVQVSVRHDTLYIEYGTEQINTDWEEYWNVLPDVYKKFSKILREVMVQNVGNLADYFSQSHHFDSYNITFIVDSWNLYEMIENIMTYTDSYNIIQNNTESQQIHIKSRLLLIEILNLTSLSYVKSVLSNINATFVQSLDRSVSFIGASTLINNGIEDAGPWTGSGTTVGILDTGGGYNTGSEIVFHPAIVAEPISGGWRGLIDYKDCTGGTEPCDAYGHGTHITGIIGSNGNNELLEITQYQGVAPNALLASAKISGNPIMGTDFDDNFEIYKSGVEWLIEASHRSTISATDINGDTTYPYWGSTDILQTSIGILPDQDILVNDGNNPLSVYIDYVSSINNKLIVVAAGNYGPSGGAPSDGTIVVPGDAYNVITVGASEGHRVFNEQWSDFSSYRLNNGDFDRASIDLIAPGAEIYSTNNDFNGVENDDWVVGSGTSYAAPHVSGVSALLYENLQSQGVESQRPLVTKAVLMNSANKLNQPYSWEALPVNSIFKSQPIDTYQGAGSVDAYEAMLTVEELRYKSENIVDSTNKYYYFNLNSEEDTPTTFTTTLVWNRCINEVTDENQEKSLIPEPLSNFNLYLYKINIDGSATLLYGSESVRDNVEHIYKELTEPGYYAIELQPVNLHTPEDIAIAFSHLCDGSGETLFPPVDVFPEIIVHSPTLSPEPNSFNNWYISTIPNELMINIDFKYDGYYDLDYATYQIFHEDGSEGPLVNTILSNYINNGVNGKYYGDDAGEAWVIPIDHLEEGVNRVEINAYTTMFDQSGKYCFNDELEIKIDALPPSGNILINNDVDQTLIRSCSLDLSDISDSGTGLNQMRFANDLNYDWRTNYWIIQSLHPVDPGYTRSVELSGGPDTTKMKVHFERIDIKENVDFIYIKNSQGNILASYTGSYPTGVEWTSSEADGDINWIEIYIYIGSHEDEIDYYGFKIDWYSYYTQRWSSWEPFSTSKAWTLSGGLGEKTVYCEVSDIVGNMYQTNDQIQYVQYETSVTTAGTVVDGVKFTNSNIVNLGMTSQVIPTQVRFSNSASDSWLYQSNPNFENIRSHWWHLNTISPAIEPYPDGCGIGASSTVELKGGAGMVQLPAEATTWRVNFAYIHLLAGDTIKFQYYVPTADKWALFDEYTGPLDISPKDSFEIPKTTQYSTIRLRFTSANVNAQSPFGVTSYEWRNNNQYYVPYYENWWTISGDPYAPKIGIRFEKIDLGSGDRLTVYHHSGNILRILDGPVTYTNYFIKGENSDDIVVRLVSLDPDSRGWGIKITGRYCFDRVWTGPLTWSSTYNNWDLFSYGGTTGDGTKTVAMQSIDDEGTLIISTDVIILDTTPPTILSSSISESSQYVHGIGTNLYYQPGYSSSFTILVDVDDVNGLDRAEGTSAFGVTPSDTTLDAGQFELPYTIESGATFSGNIVISVYDHAGNYISAVIAVATDETGPTVSLSLPPDESYTSDNTPSLSWSASDGQSGPSGNYHLQVIRESDSTMILDTDMSATSYTFSTSLDDGTYYWQVKAEDNVGNWGEYVGYRFTVDTQTPTAEITSVVPLGTDPEIFNITGTAQDDNFKKYKVEVGEDIAPISWVTIAQSSTPPASELLSTWDTSTFVNGNYNIRLTVTDMAGNEASTSTSVAVDNTLIITSVSATPDIFVSKFESTTIKYTINKVAYVTVHILDSQGGLVVVLLDSMYQNKGINSVMWDGTDSSGKGVEPGTFTFVIHAEIDTETAEVSGTVNTRFPKIEIRITAWGDTIQVWWDEWNRAPMENFEKYEMIMEVWVQTPTEYYLKYSTTKESTDYYKWSFYFTMFNPPWSSPLTPPSECTYHKYKFILKEISDNDVRISNTATMTTGGAYPISMWWWTHMGGGGGCPYLYVWNGTGYDLDNTILGESEVIDRLNLPVEDYYKIQQPMVLGDDGNYQLSIVEFENEHSYLDQFELITVDHKPGTEIQLSQDGSIYTVKDPIPPSRSCKPGSPLTSYLSLVEEADDDKFIEGIDGFNALVYFDDEYDLTNAKLVIKSDMKPGSGGGGGGSLSTEGPDGPILIHFKNPLTGEWDTVGEIYPRALWSTDIIDLSQYAYLGNTSLRFMFEWQGHHKLDYVGLDLSEQENFYVQRLSPSSATHSERGLVTYDVTLPDNRYVELVPGEWMNVTFPYAPTSLERDFIFYSKGYYNLSFANADLSVDKAEVQTFENIIFDASVMSTM